MTIVTTSLLIVVKAAIQADANITAQIAEPTTDLNTFSTPLRNAGDASGTTVAYWCNWWMDDNQRARLIAEFGKKFGRAIEPIPVGGRVDKRNSFWVFEGNWNPDNVLAVLGYDIMPAGEG